MDSTYFEYLDYAIYGSSVLVILIGLYGALVKKSLLKVVIGLSIMEAGVNLLFIALGYLKNCTAPIFSSGYDSSQVMVDPIPQALVLTAIVIGFGVTAVALSLVIRLWRHHHTLSIDQIKNLKW